MQLSSLINKSKDKQQYCSYCNKKQFCDKDDQGEVRCSECGIIISTDNFDNSLQFTDTKKDGQIVEFGIPNRDRAKQAEQYIKEMVYLLKLNSDYPDHYEMISETPLRIIKFAYNGLFLDHGSNIKHYSAAALYIALRFYKAPFLLMDFSEKLSVNIYKLARCYKKLAKFLNRTLKLNEQLPPVDPSLYIPRFCKELDFQERAEEVSRTALRLLKRMKLDWISHGRRPSSLCGAAILIAARLGGFKCTTHEVSNKVHVCEETLRRRLEEFQETDTAKLTKDEFNQYQDNVENIGEEKNPPSFMKSQKQLLKLKMNNNGDEYSINNDNYDCNSKLALSETNEDKDSKYLSPNIQQKQQSSKIDARIYEQEIENIVNNNQNVLKDEFSYDINSNNGNSFYNAIEEGNSIKDLNLQQVEQIYHKSKQIRNLEECNKGNQISKISDFNQQLVLANSNELNINALNIKEDLSDLGEDEKGQYILSDTEQNVKRVIWHSMNSVWLQEQQEKELKAKTKQAKKRNKRRNDQLLNEDNPIMALYQSKKFMKLNREKVNFVLNQQVENVQSTKLEDIFQKKQMDTQELMNYQNNLLVIKNQDQQENQQHYNRIQAIKMIKKQDEFEYDDDQEIAEED